MSASASAEYTKPLNCLVFEKIAFLHFGVKIQDGGDPDSAAHRTVHMSIVGRAPSAGGGRNAGMDLFLFPSPFFSLPSVPSPVPNQLEGLGERCKLGLGRATRPQTHICDIMSLENAFGGNKSGRPVN